MESTPQPHVVGSQDFQLLVGYEMVRSAARNWETYSSATPFRVPIPEESELRDVCQYPIETDPPLHRTYRRLIDSRFSRAAAQDMRPTLERLVEGALEEADRVGGLEVVRHLAIPVATTAIAHTIGRPQDAELFASWGIHVFVDPATGERRRNTSVDDYLRTRVDDALEQPGSYLFGDLAKATIEGRRLTRDEILGFGSLVLAGGRDTVINSIVGALWHLSTHPDAIETLAEGPGALTSAVEEYLRYFSPLPFIGRTVRTEHTVGQCPLSAGDLVALGFAAANHDPTAFSDPSTIALDRRPNRHVAFGHGPHTCIGAPLARMQLEVVLAAFVGRGQPSLVPSHPWQPRPEDAIVSSDWIPRDLHLGFPPTLQRVR